MSEFHFLRPFWLLALVPALALAWWCLRSTAQQAGAWSRLIDPQLLPALLRPAPGRDGRLRLALLAAGWTLAILALAGPAWERLPEPVHQRSDGLVIALDLSLSMLAADIAPSRLERARFKLRDLLAARGDGYTALVAWAGDAHTVTPLSDDAATITSLLDALDPSVMPLPGSDPVAAVRLAGELLQGAGLASGRVLLVGDSLTESQAEEIAPLLERFGLELSVLAVGTANGAPVPLADGGFARSNDGSIVVTTMDPEQMEAAAARAGARFAQLSIDDSDLQRLLPETPMESAVADRASRRFDQWLDRAPWIACLLLPLAAAAFRRGWLLVLPLAVLALPRPAAAFEWQDLWITPDQRGARSLESGDAAGAAREFRSPDWRGTAAYEAGDYAAAASAFAEAEGADSQYNLGNALARTGKLEEALAAYDAALAAQPDMEDARHNRELVEQLLEQQQQQQQQQPSGQQQQPSGSSDEGQQQAGSDADDGQQQPGQSEDAQSGNDSESGAQPTDADKGQSGRPDAHDGRSDDSSDDTPQSGTNTARGEQDRGKDAAADDAAAQRADEDKSPDSSAQSRAAIEGDAGQSERDQALEQWLRQVPDDPGALLRRKFEYESRARRAGERP